MGSTEIDSRPPSYVVNLVSDDEAVDEDVEGDEDERGTDGEEDFAGGTQGFEDFDDGRRFVSDAKKDWTQEEERMFYETYLSTHGNMKKVCNAMERAPYERDRKLVQKFRFNATRRLQGCLKSLNLSLDTKDKREVLEAFRSYWKFRQAEGLEGENVRAFGLRLGDGLKTKCAEALQRDLIAARLRPGYGRVCMSRVRIDGAHFVGHAKSKVWCARFNNVTAYDLAIIERGLPRVNQKNKVRWMAVGIEQGPRRPSGWTEERSGDDVDIEDLPLLHLPLLHLQVSLQTEMSTTWDNMATWVETYLSTPGHIEPSNGSLDDNRRDCSKTGHFREYGDAEPFDAARAVMPGERDDVGNFREYGDAEPFDAARAAKPGKRNDVGNSREYGDTEPFDAARAAKPGKRNDIGNKDETVISTKRTKPDEDSLNDTDCMKIRVIFSEISFTHPDGNPDGWHYNPREHTTHVQIVNLKDEEKCKHMSTREMLDHVTDKAELFMNSWLHKTLIADGYFYWADNSPEYKMTQQWTLIKLNH